MPGPSFSVGNKHKQAKPTSNAESKRSSPLSRPPPCSHSQITGYDGTARKTGQPNDNMVALLPLQGLVRLVTCRLVLTVICCSWLSASVDFSIQRIQAKKPVRRGGPRFSSVAVVLRGAELAPPAENTERAQTHLRGTLLHLCHVRASSSILCHCCKLQSTRRWRLPDR